MSAHSQQWKALSSFGLLTGLAVGLAGCTWQGYAVSRGIRLVTGASTRVHVVVPITTSLRRYRVIEIHRLNNMLPGRIPPPLEDYVNDVLAGEWHRLPSAPAIVNAAAEPVAGAAGVSGVPRLPTLEFEGVIDDYDPGYLGLRLIELGFNHLVVTVSIQLRDKRTGTVVGAASITAQDDRPTATARAAIRRLAGQVRAFVRTGYAR
jgi:hypothetical protein